jgi:hypothetical protein
VQDDETSHLGAAEHQQQQHRHCEGKLDRDVASAAT